MFVDIFFWYGQEHCLEIMITVVYSGMGHFIVLLSIITAVLYKYWVNNLVMIFMRNHRIYNIHISSNWRYYVTFGADYNTIRFEKGRKNFQLVTHVDDTVSDGVN